ncbi:MAG: putative toxin-antitoxin system toxin component, PIN family [Chloroflexi bacterium]|nr:putative toxin-antitoxin system toxin component, PIN family [Chloroflexota bacterium]
MKLWQTLLLLLSKFAPSGVRTVVDTNVLISGTIVRFGASARIVDAALAREIVLVVAPTLIDEYLDVIRRPHIAKRYREITPRVQDVVEFLHHRAIRVKGKVVEPVLNDPDDDFLLAAALEGKAKYIISGDEHLLELAHYRGIKILTPREFVEQMLSRKTASTT